MKKSPSETREGRQMKDSSDFHVGERIVRNVKSVLKKLNLLPVPEVAEVSRSEKKFHSEGRKEEEIPSLGEV